MTGPSALAFAETPESVGFDSGRLRRLDAYMDGLVHDGRVAGACALLARRGKVVAFGTYGKARLADDALLTRDAIFRIYSMTKPVVGVAMMILFEQGKWQLDDPVTAYIPEFQNLEVMAGSGPNGAMLREPVRHSMTMRHLMSHTAGFGYGIFDSNAVDRMFRERQVMRSNSLRQMIERTAEIPLLFQPGAGWSYSNTVDIQGYVVEKLSGTTLGQFLDAQIFAPLRMSDTGFSVAADQVHRLVGAYTADAHGRLREARTLFGAPINDYTRPPRVELGGSGLVSTAADYARFC